MRTRDVDLLIIEGWRSAPPDHWQSRWARHFKTARVVAQADRETPRRDEWVATIAAAVDAATRPAVLVAHGLGVITVAHAAAALAARRVAGAFLVAPPDLDGSEHWPANGGGFAPVPLARLPFPARLIASSNDPYCRFERAQHFGAAWGADVSIIANAGHIDTTSGHGPWPEGLLTLGQFLASLGPTAAG